MGGFSLQISKMLQQYLRAYRNQNDSPKHLYLLLKEMPEPPADDDPNAGEDKCHQTNHDYRGNYGDIKKGKPKADGKCVNACCDGKDKQDIYAQHLYLLFSLFYLPCLIDHLCANSSKQQERNPVVNTGDHIPEAQSGKPPNHRHKRLKCPKEECNSKRPPHMERLHGNPAGDGDSKGIHCKTNCNKKYS